MRLKQLFIDTETTGTYTETVGLYQFGGIIVAGKRGEEFEFNCDIFEEDDVDLKALETNGITLEEISQFPDPQQVFEQFISVLDKYVDRYNPMDKFVVYGYGAKFDQQMLRNWFYKLGDDYFGSWFWHPFVDIMNLAMYIKQGERRNLANFKMQTVADYLHIRTDKTRLHTALYDAQIAKKIYEKLDSFISLSRNADGNEKAHCYYGVDSDIPF